MSALRPAVGVFLGVAAAVVLWNLVALGVGVVREVVHENDRAIVVAGSEGTYQRYEPYAASAGIEALMGWTALAIALLAVPNRHWLPGWRLRGTLQALGAAASLAMLVVLFTDRAEFSAGNRPYTLAWLLPVLAVTAGGALARAWSTRDVAGASTGR